MAHKIMKNTIAASILVFGVSGIVVAQHLPLSCGDFVLLTETAVQHRDTKISKSNSKMYLAEDEYLSNKEKNQIRQMIDRVYASPREGKSYFIALARKECRQ